MESTFVLLKPSAVVLGLVGQIITRFERKGLKIVALKMIQVKREEAQKLYAIHEGKPFYDELIQHITSAPIVTFVVEGENAVSVTRRLIGATDPKDAHPGTIRGDLSIVVHKNIIHAADTQENAEREIGIFFTKDEFLNYRRADEDWIY
jgi:nucleoside-diphosphate kinase